MFKTFAILLLYNNLNVQNFFESTFNLLSLYQKYAEIFRISGIWEREAWNYKNLDRFFRYDLVFNAIERGILIKRYTSDLRMECQDRHRLPNQFATGLAASLSPYESVSVNLYEEMPRMRLCLVLKIEECDDDEVKRPINRWRWSRQEEKALRSDSLH